MYKLTSRQGQILRLLVQGKRQREVAGELFLSVKTVEASMERARCQWGCRTMVQLAAKVPERRLR